MSPFAVMIVVWTLLWLVDRPANAGAETGAGADPFSHVHGMTVSCQTWGWEWGSDAMLGTLDELKTLGVNWIAIHPYGRIQRDGTISWRHVHSGADWLSRPIAEAHKRGLKILIKPHVAHWRAGFAWAGDIAFDRSEQWHRFFTTYRDWLVALASATRDADAFCVGTELDRTVDHDIEWRRVIAAVRQVRSAGPLTYAANWDSYERVGFWDALDAISVHGYFPLVHAEAAPDEAALEAGVRAWVTRLEKYGRAHNRKVVIGELGYDISPDAARRPWESGRASSSVSFREDAREREAAEQLQARCLTASLDAIDRSEIVVGAFLWKWFPGGEEDSRGENFLMSTPAMRVVIAKLWAKGRVGWRPQGHRAP